MKTKITVFYLEMLNPDDFRPSTKIVKDLEIMQVKIPCPEYNRFLYSAVGRDWNWYGKLSWTDNQWEEHVNRPGLETWVAYISGTPAGYFELNKQPGNNVEILYFGLLPKFIGQGLGGLLLTEAVRHAWDTGAKRVWLHTCSLDHPAALENYKSRGFSLFKQETEYKELPDAEPGKEF
ncbi:GNAT family N-acetyltransferase [candidate division KSB1 bacterium]|nr:GNAT family N-acetyltransferase [candidate division KSB1 bacterium]